HDLPRRARRPRRRTQRAVGAVRPAVRAPARLRRRGARAGAGGVTVRVAVGQTPLTATLDEAVPTAVAAVEGAGRLEAQVLCLPETCLPGHRSQPRPVPEYAAAELDAAVDAVAAAAGRAGVVTIVGAERPTPAGREIVAV